MPNATDYYVFRATGAHVRMGLLIDGLRSDVLARRYADAVVRAGEIESALEDEQAGGAAAASARAAVALTDALASALVEEAGPGDGPGSRAVEGLDVLSRELAGRGSLFVVPPEAFSYYALHPRDVVRATAAPRLARVGRAAVVGLRSIGTTMSALVAAAIRARGGTVERRTVRPTGPPYARRTRLDADALAWLRHHEALGSDFLVVDEGPGVSGSSLLSAVDALVAAGVSGHRITVLCTRRPDPGSLLARDGSRRWSALRVATIDARLSVPAGFRRIPAGDWRTRFLGRRRQWPASWTWAERPKATSEDELQLAKWEGLGRHGSDARVRSAVLAEAGFGPRAVPEKDGWVVYEIADGGAAGRRRLTADGLDRLADYCAWRAVTFERSAVDPGLLDMIRRNGEIILGGASDASSAPWSRCEVVRPVLADARMMPHEWVGRECRTWVKTDASLHGDDHLFPGPTDAAWDVAGAIAEWRMTSGEAEHFVARYRRSSGDDVAPRLPPWLAAYSLCRIAVTEFAAATVDDAEKRRFLRESAGYRRWMRRATQAFAGARAPRSR